MTTRPGHVSIELEMYSSTTPEPAAWIRRSPAAAPPIARRPARGLANLTPRELEVLAMISEGVSNLAVARELFLSVRTVECYVARIFDKLGLEQHADEHRRVKATLAYQRWAVHASAAEAPQAAVG